MRIKDKDLFKIRTPYGVKNWAYVKKLFDNDVKENINLSKE